MCSSTTTSETVNKTGDLSSQGASMLSILQSMGMVMLDQAGYDVSSQEVTQYADVDAANNLENQITKLEDDLNKRPPHGRFGGAGFIPDERVKRLNDLKAKLGDMEKITYQKYDVKEKPDPRVKDAIDKYGEDSQQVKDIKQQISDEKVYEANLNADSHKNYIEAINKVTKGDYSFTPQQEQQINAFLGPMREVLATTTQSLLDQVDATDLSMKDALNTLSSEIDRTGFTTESALRAASLQIDQNGQYLTDIVRRVNESDEAKAKFQFDLLSQQADQKAAQQGALYGLPPGSGAEKALAAKIKADALTAINLSLNQSELQNTLGIAKETVAQKNSINLASVNLALSQGGKKEDVARAGLNLAQLTGGKKESIFSENAQGEMNIAKNKSNLLIGAATSQPLTGISAMQGFTGSENQNTAARLGIAGAATAYPNSIWGVEEQRTFAENSSNTTQTSSPSIMDSIFGGLSAGASIGSSIFSSIKPSPTPVQNIFRIT